VQEADCRGGDRPQPLSKCSVTHQGCGGSPAVATSASSALRADGLAAERARFGNCETYWQALKVVDKAAALVEAMDAERASISAAALLAELDPVRQE
jgi:hypothetical protein